MFFTLAEIEEIFKFGPTEISPRKVRRILIAYLSFADISHIHIIPYFIMVEEENIMKMLANQGSVETIQTNICLVSEPSSVSFLCIPS